MLRLIDITKVYSSGDSEVRALKGIDISFRKSEFVSILGHSGCGKTTLLNIIGGLDHYTSGDLIVDGISTKEYKDRDWDNYRNHSIGFVFQSYNLIPHQTVLGNVELALTLSGVKRSDRRMLAQAALVKVGLADQLHKLPNQLSGGQMQRVAIARALVNDPEIILADEPTGALDTETSVQVMEILKEVSKEKLVIMVTHNPELAEQYSTRIVRLKDGEVIADSMPYDDREESAELPCGGSPTEPTLVAQQEEQDESMKELVQEQQKAAEVSSAVSRSKKKPSMSLFTAFALSIRNLFTKKGRTFLTAFAGSIGIIGIALILSLSNGFRNYIAQVEENTLAGYPIVIRAESTNVGFTDMMEAFMPADGSDSDVEDDQIHSNPLAATLLKKMRDNAYRNDLGSFRSWLMTEKKDVLDKITNSIAYTYDTKYNVYSYEETQNPDGTQGSPVVKHLYPFSSDNFPQQYKTFEQMMGNLPIWEELATNQKYLDQQYEVIAGNWPKAHEASDGEVFDVVLTVDRNNSIYDYLLWAIGYTDIFSNPDAEAYSYEFDDFIGKEYKIVLAAEQYTKKDGVWVKQIDGEEYAQRVGNAITIRISGIIRPKEGVTMGSIQGVIAYRSDLTEYIMEKTTGLELVQAQIASKDKNVLSGENFEDPETDYKKLLSALGVADIDDPSAIKFYVKGFDEKDRLIALIDEYNDLVRDENPDLVIRYTDSIGALMSSINTIIDAISYVLIAFVSISLIVSSIMIGIITYISVLERTKEIGVLRSIGASKRDISRLFNAETLTIGFMSGVFGILLTLLLIIPINIIISYLTGIATLGAALPALGGIALILISMFLSFIAGFIPSKIAAKKDPVIALRTE